MKIDDDEPRLVECTKFQNGVRVSTVLLTSGECFETLVFDKNNCEERCLQTTDRQQALHDHKKCCVCVAVGEELPDNRYV